MENMRSSGETSGLRRSIHDSDVGGEEIAEHLRAEGERAARPSDAAELAALASHHYDEEQRQRIDDVLEENSILLTAIVEARIGNDPAQCIRMQEHLQRNLAVLGSLLDVQAARAAVPDDLLPMPAFMYVQGADPNAPSQGAASKVRNMIEKRKRYRHWTGAENRLFAEAVEKFGTQAATKIARYIGSRTPRQVRSRLQKYIAKRKRSLDPAVPPTDHADEVADSVQKNAQ